MFLKLKDSIFFYFILLCDSQWQQNCFVGHGLVCHIVTSFDISNIDHLKKKKEEKIYGSHSLRTNKSFLYTSVGLELFFLNTENSYSAN